MTRLEYMMFCSRHIDLLPKASKCRRKNLRNSTHFLQNVLSINEDILHVAFCGLKFFRLCRSWSLSISVCSLGSFIPGFLRSGVLGSQSSSSSPSADDAELNSGVSGSASRRPPPLSDSIELSLSKPASSESSPPPAVTHDRYAIMVVYTMRPSTGWLGSGRMKWRSEAKRSEVAS